MGGSGLLGTVIVGTVVPVGTVAVIVTHDSTFGARAAT